MTMTLPGSHPGTHDRPGTTTVAGAVDPDQLEAFLALSVTLTGYSRFRLLGTGQAEAYFATTRACVGEDVLDDLLAVSQRVHAEAAAGRGDPDGADDAAAGQAGALDGDAAAALDRGVRAEILSDEQRGPVARNVIKMWFVGTWYQLPQEWRDVHGTRRADVTHVVAPASYTEGLLWPTIGANPPGAKAPGFGTWAYPPAVDPG